MYAVCCEFTGCKNDNFQIKSLVIGMLITIFFFNLQNVSFLCNCGGLAIIVSKISYKLQYGLTYTMQTLTHTYDANVRMYPDT